MNENVVRTFGQLVARQLPAHPERARRLLSTAYQFVGAQMRYVPPKGMLRARSYLQGVTSPLMAKALGRAGQCACVNVFMPCELLHALDITPHASRGALLLPGVHRRRAAPLLRLQRSAACRRATAPTTSCCWAWRSPG